MKHVRDYYDRPNKAQSREWMFLDIPHRTSILTLPSQQIACVNHMRNRQIIGPTTHQQWVERNSRIAQLLKLRLHDHTHLHHGDLEDYEPTEMVDLANLDMESSFTERLGLWIEHKLAPMLMPNSYVILTVMGFGRHNDFMEQWLPIQISNGLFRDELHQMKLLSGCLNDDILLPGVMLRSALHKYDAHRVRSAGYRDREGSDMLSVCFYVSKPAQTTVTPFSEVVANYRREPITIQRLRGTGPTREVLATVTRTLATLNFSITPAEGDKWWIHNHDHTKTTLPLPLSLDEIVQFFQITPRAAKQLSSLTTTAKCDDTAARDIAADRASFRTGKVIDIPVAAMCDAQRKSQPMRRANPIMQEAGRKAWITRQLRATAKNN